jgi:hypothetical protein
MALDINTKTRVFLDREAVAKAVGKENAKTLGRMGAFVRRTQRQSMRRRMKPSAPGTPPSAHSGPKFPRGPLLKKFIFSEFDLTTNSVVIGPTKLGRSDAPSKQEHGGSIRIKVLPPKKTGRKATPLQSATFKRKLKDGSIVRPAQQSRVVAANLPARPSARPALAKELPKFPSLYANTVKP